MRDTRTLRWLAGVVALVGAALLGSRLRRTPEPALEPALDPAEELRRKLAERRTDAPDSEPVEEEAAAAEPAADPDARRRTVHEQARAAVDQMQRRDATAE